MGSKKKPSKRPPGGKKKKKKTVLKEVPGVTEIPECVGVAASLAFDTSEESHLHKAELRSLTFSSDGVRFVDTCPGCTSPEIYESHEDGKVITVKLPEKTPYIEFQDTGNGVKFKYATHGSYTHMDYATLGLLIRSAQIMNAMQKNSLFGDHMWVGPNGDVGKFNTILQKFAEERKKN